MIAELHLQGLSETVVQLAAAVKMDSRKAVAQAARLLAVEIAVGAPPKTGEAGKKNIEKSLRGFLAPEQTNVRQSARSHFVGNFEWFSVGQVFLKGVESKDNFSDQDEDVILRKFRSVSGSKFRGPKWTKIGRRGVQNVFKLNRMLVKPAAFASIKRKLISHIGRLKASWYQTAFDLRHKNIPAIAKRHLPSRKSITRLGGLKSDTFPSVEFGSKATGVSRMEEIVLRAVNIRRKKTAALVKRVARGYAQQHNAKHAIKSGVQES